MILLSCLLWIETSFCQLSPTICSSMCQCVTHSLIHFKDVIIKLFWEISNNYQKVPLVSLCSTVGAAGTGVLLDPQGLALVVVPTPGASLPGEKVSGPWLMVPEQRNILPG